MGRHSAGMARQVPAAPGLLSAGLLCSCARCVGSAPPPIPPLLLPMQREATVTAGKIAGLEAVRIIRCRCAAAGLGGRGVWHE